MGMTDGRARLSKAMKELMLRWSETRMQWDDAAAKAFEDRFLTPLEMDSRQATGAMDVMGQMLSQLRRDCE
jgi:hypothetical protein